MQFNQFCFFDVKVLCYLQVLKNTKFVQIVLGVIYIVRPHKGGGEGSSQMFKVAYVRKKKFFLDNKISKLFFFCTKEAIALPFIIVY